MLGLLRYHNMILRRSSIFTEIAANTDDMMIIFIQSLVSQVFWDDCRELAACGFTPCQQVLLILRSKSAIDTSFHCATIVFFFFLDEKVSNLLMLLDYAHLLLAVLDIVARLFEVRHCLHAPLPLHLQADLIPILRSSIETGTSAPRIILWSLVIAISHSSSWAGR